MNRGSLIIRSVVAILLLIGFYALALGVVGRDVSFRAGELRLSPFRDFGELARGKLSEAGLVERLTAAGVATLKVHSSNSRRASLLLSYILQYAPASRLASRAPRPRSSTDLAMRGP